MAHRSLLRLVEHAQQQSPKPRVVSESGTVDEVHDVCQRLQNRIAGLRTVLTHFVHQCSQQRWHRTPSTQPEHIGVISLDTVQEPRNLLDGPHAPSERLVAFELLQSGLDGSEREVRRSAHVMWRRARAANAERRGRPQGARGLHK